MLIKNSLRSQVDVVRASLVYEENIQDFSWNFFLGTRGMPQSHISTEMGVIGINVCHVSVNQSIHQAHSPYTHAGTDKNARAI
jgi:hypothetical protein